MLAIGASRPGAVELVVELRSGPGAGEVCRALAYPDLVGLPEPGDEVLLNAGALEQGLGTGGLAFVIALPQRVRQTATRTRHRSRPLNPLQARCRRRRAGLAAPHAAARRDDLAGMPVVVDDLHSPLPAIVAGVRAHRPDARVAYLMTDGGALPAWFSRTVARLRDVGWLACCISVGQAFGGDLEAVTLHTGLLAARLAERADLAVVAQGPGNLGTGTRWGFSGVAAGEALNAAAVLGGQPVAALRVSGADPREAAPGGVAPLVTGLRRVAWRRQRWSCRSWRVSSRQ